MNDDLEKVVSDIEESASECCAEMREKASELCGTVEDYVRQEPMKSVVIAAGLGLVAGLLLSRR
ncbi:MAG TPA: hypothetical protein VGI75_15500 [Pirellulales bacterium]|jgi:ElaB/YqjD/DUF883 family membrane-anchored ribosome-binding protein